MITLLPLNHAHYPALDTEESSTLVVLTNSMALKNTKMEKGWPLLESQKDQCHQLEMDQTFLDNLPSSPNQYYLLLQFQVLRENPAIVAATLFSKKPSHQRLICPLLAIDHLLGDLNQNPRPNQISPGDLKSRLPVLNPILVCPPK